MKVLFVLGGNINGFEMAPFIKEQGESLKNQGVQVDYYPVVGKGLSGYLKSAATLRKYLKENPCDIIHAHFTLSGWVARLAAGKTPVVLSLLGNDAYGEYVGVNKVRFSSRYSTVLTWLIQPFVRAIISKAQNIENYVYLKRKSYIIPNGINKEKFNSKPIDGQFHAYANNGKKQVLFLGNKKDVRKNFALAQAAVEYLNRPDVELINPYPISHKEVPYYMTTANVLVVPSLMEGSPNVVKEAMACNCPIVASDTGDIKWVLGNTEGCFVSSFDVKEFAAKIELALQFSERKGRTNGKQRILELGLDAETVARRVIGVYETALGIHSSETVVWPKKFSDVHV